MLSGDSVTMPVEAVPQTTGAAAPALAGRPGAPPSWAGAAPACSRVLRCATFRRSLGCAWRGICSTLDSQRNMRIQCAIAAAVLVAGLFLGLEPLEWVAIVVSAAVVLAAEMTNTVVETVVDLVSPGYSEAARLAKDAAAGAVLVASVAAAVVGLLVLGPHLLDWLRQ